MGVYISGMEMPEDGRYTLSITRDSSGNVHWVFQNEDTYEFLKHGCVKQLPPHGRLIDADALVERIEGIWDCNDMVFRPNDKICKIPEDCKGCKWAQTKDCIQRMVENAPTIIPADGEDTDVPTREEEV